MQNEAQLRAERGTYLWVGWFEQFGTRSPQSMELSFVDRTITGEGIDEIGEFTIEGGFGASAPSTPVGWIKTYVDAHSVLYVGALEGADRLHGRWSIGEAFSGQFEFRRES